MNERAELVPNASHSTCHVLPTHCQCVRRRFDHHPHHGSDGKKKAFLHAYSIQRISVLWSKIDLLAEFGWGASGWVSDQSGLRSIGAIPMPYPRAALVRYRISHSYTPTAPSTSSYRHSRRRTLLQGRMQR